MGTSKETTRGYAGEMSPEARRIMQQLAETQMGNEQMQALARGELDITQQDRDLVNQSQDAMAQMARIRAERAMEDAARQSEAQMLERGLDSSSIEAINNALLGQQFQDQMGQIALQQQAQGSEALMNMPFQRAQTTMNANQLLMNRLVQGAQVGLGYDRGIRQLNQTTETSKPSNLPGQILGMGAQIGTAMATGGASVPVQAAASMQNPFGGGNYSTLPPALQQWSDGARASGEPWRPR
jgi:hypothetical protein